MAALNFNYLLLAVVVVAATLLVSSVFQSRNRENEGYLQLELEVENLRKEVKTLRTLYEALAANPNLPTSKITAAPTAPPTAPPTPAPTLPTPTKEKTTAPTAVVVAANAPPSYGVDGQEPSQCKIPDVAKVEEMWFQHMKYWHPNDAEKVIDQNRILAFIPWQAGLNNRRISLEMVYVMSFLTKRTLVLPKKYVQHPIPDPQGYQDVYNFEDMKRGVPVISHEEFGEMSKSHGPAGWWSKPHKDVAVCDWKNVPRQATQFVWPKTPEKGTPEFEEMKKVIHNRADNTYDSFSVPGFNTSYVLYFPPSTLFNHYYSWFYFPTTNPLYTQIRQLVKDHVHFRKDIYQTAARMLACLPPTFSTIHYRRGDLQYKTQRNLKPELIYNNTLGLFKEGETIYVATDEKPDVFEKEFVSVFKKRYHIVYWSKFSHVHPDGVKKIWIPATEMVLCTQGRVFVGTLLSTFSGYITRLRGYMTQIPNDKHVYWTSYKYPEQYKIMDHFTNIPVANHGWGREWPDAWEGLN